MKAKVILPIVTLMVLMQMIPQAALSQCYPYMSHHEARRLWRAEHCGYAPYGGGGMGMGYAAPMPAYGYGGYGGGYYGYHHGLLTNVARAVF